MKHMRNCVSAALGLAFAALIAPPSSKADIFTLEGIATGSQQTPPVPSTGSGSITVTFDNTTNMMSFTISYSGLSGAVTAVHIHRAAFGVAGPVIFDIPPTPSPVTGVLTLTPAQASDLLSGLFYLNIHTTSFPDGEVRAQLTVVSVACSPHRVHGHISTVPPTHSAIFHVHHGTHGHTVVANCPPHTPGHSSALTLDAEEGLFSTGGGSALTGFVAALNEDGTVNGNPAAAALPGVTTRPARRGSMVQLFGPAVGLLLGEQDGPPALGFTPPASGSLLYYTTTLPQVRIGGAPTKVLFSGLAPGLTGVWQVNVLIPEDAPVGAAVAVAISFEGEDWDSVALAVQ